jgi:hypothetical protein
MQLTEVIHKRWMFSFSFLNVFSKVKNGFDINKAACNTKDAPGD